MDIVAMLHLGTVTYMEPITQTHLKPPQIGAGIKKAEKITIFTSPGRPWGEIVNFCVSF